MSRYDLAIVGSGPAGAAAAITAHRRGLRAVIIDKAEFPRDKTCGDGLTTNALRLVEHLGISLDALTDDASTVTAAGVGAGAGAGVGAGAGAGVGAGAGIGVGAGVDVGAGAGVGGYRKVDDIVLVGPNGRATNLALPRNRGEYACVISRWRLDAALVDAVATTLVERRYGRAVQRVETLVPTIAGVAGTAGSVVACVASSGVAGTGVALTLDDDSVIEASFAIAADGHWSTLRRSVESDAPRDLGEWHAARQYFSNAGDNKLWVLFEPDLLPGYLWIFPLPNGRANVGFGVLRNQKRTGKELKELWPALLARPHVQRILGPSAVPEGSVKAWPIPTRYEPESLVDGRVLFTGDAARVVDPMTGEGIAQAFETGILAANAVAHFRHSACPVDDVARAYRSSVHQALGRDLQFAHQLQRVLAHNIGTRAALRTVDLNDWTRRHFARWMFEDYPRAILLTPGRWRPNPFRVPAAFQSR